MTAALLSFNAAPPRRDGRSANQLVVSIFRDLLPAEVDTVWLSELIALVKPLGLTERCLRTSLFRLAQLGVVRNVRVGRRSAYQLVPEHGQPGCDERGAWDGNWSVAVCLTGKSTLRQRDACDADLHALGFRAVTPGVLLRPRSGDAQVAAILTRHGMRDAMLVFDAARPSHPDHPSLTAMVADCWRLDRLAQAYRQYAEQCAELLAQLDLRVGVLDASSNYAAGARLLDAWHVLSVADPALPAALLPADWPAPRAAALARQLRQRIGEGAYLRHVLAPAGNGPRPGAALNAQAA